MEVILLACLSVNPGLLPFIPMNLHHLYVPHLLLLYIIKDFSFLLILTALSTGLSYSLVFNMLYCEILLALL